MADEPRYEVFPEKLPTSLGATPADDTLRLTGEFVWHYRDANGKLTHTAGESFTRRRDAHRAIRGVVYDNVRLLVGQQVGISMDMRIPIVDLDENGEVIGAGGHVRGMTGRRVAEREDLTGYGDYCVIHDADGSVESLWMLLPRTGTQGRIAAVGHGVPREGVTEPEWTIVENPSGTVTVLPSIDEGGGGYHGFLTDGVWSDG